MIVWDNQNQMSIVNDFSESQDDSPIGDSNNTSNYIQK